MSSSSVSPAGTFNAAVRQLFNVFEKLDSGMKAKLHIKELRSKMNTGMQTLDSYAINAIGPYIWRARANIAAGNAQPYIARRYELDIQPICRDHGVNYDNAINTVNFMKDAFGKASAEKQAEITSLVQTLLGAYAQLLQIQAAEAK